MSESIATLKRKPSLDHDSPMPSSGPPSPSADDQGEAKVKRVRTTAELVSKSKTVNKLIGKFQMLITKGPKLVLCLRINSLHLQL